MTREELTATLNALADRMWGLVDIIGTYFENAFGDAINSKTSFADLI